MGRNTNRRGWPTLSCRALSVWFGLALLVAACSGGGDDAESGGQTNGAGTESDGSASADSTDDGGNEPGALIPTSDDQDETAVDAASPDGDAPNDDVGTSPGGDTIPRQNAQFADDPPGEGEAVYTGQGVPDPSVLARPALAVKIDNVDAARPQAGINQADVVFEEMVEGGLTRLLAVFHSNDPDSVGPVRSARSTDIPLLMPLANPLFSWSGSNAAFAEVLRTTAIVDAGVDSNPGLYVRRDDRTAPSNLFSSPERLRQVTPADALSPRPMFSFALPRESLGAGARDVAGVDIDFGSTEVEFRWNSVASGWARDQNGTPHVDDEGFQVAPTNLIVVVAVYENTPFVDSNGAPVPEAQIYSGRGDAWMFANGQVIEGTWYKENVTRAMIFLDSEGNRVKQVPGRSWVILAPAGTAEIVN
ncbi:MAG: DUF3048 domain-containing protein [Acidimicrobiales bacterium]